MTKRLFAIICAFVFIIGHVFKQWKHMQKSLVWRGFLSESMWVEDYRNLSFFKKLIFWVNYPFSYAKFLWVVAWDRIDRLLFRDSRARYTKISVEYQKSCKYNNSILKQLNHWENRYFICDSALIPSTSLQRTFYLTTKNTVVKALTE